MSPGRLENRVCIVTGAASGIGRAIAIQFAREGAQVVILDPRTEPVEGGDSTLEVIDQAGGKGKSCLVDVSEWDQSDGRRWLDRGLTILN